MEIEWITNKYCKSSLLVSIRSSYAIMLRTPRPPLLGAKSNSRKFMLIFLLMRFRNYTFTVLNRDSERCIGSDRNEKRVVPSRRGSSSNVNDLALHQRGRIMKSELKNDAMPPPTRAVKSATTHHIISRLCSLDPRST